MTGLDGGKKPEAPDQGVETPGDPPGKIAITPDPEDPKGDHGKDDIVTIDGKDYKRGDLSSIIGVKRSLEKENKDLKERVKGIDEADLTAVELAEKRAQEAEGRADKAERKLIVEKAQRILDTKVGVGKVNASFLNLGISSVDEVEAAVEKFIEASPGLKESPGANEDLPHVPGDEPPPGGAPRSGSREAQLLADIESAETEEELEKATKAADDWRKKTPSSGRRTI